MNVEEMVAAVKHCLTPSVDTCKNCALQFASGGCVEELFRLLDEFALEHKSQEAEIKKKIERNDFGPAP